MLLKKLLYPSCVNVALDIVTDTRCHEKKNCGEYDVMTYLIENLLSLTKLLPSGHRPKSIRRRFVMKNNKITSSRFPFRFESTITITLRKHLVNNKYLKYSAVEFPVLDYLNTTSIFSLIRMHSNSVPKSTYTI